MTAMSESLDDKPHAELPAAGLLDDQNRRWLEAEPVSVEDYLQRQPSLKEDSEALLDLIYNEVRLRDEAGQTPELQEYLGRFPELTPRIRELFEVHQAMRPGQVLADLPPADDAGRAAPLPAVDGFEVLGELGRGAMGVVYRARHSRLNRLVALKMILAGPHAGARERARFENEARAVARLQHPHIVQIHEIGEQDGRPFVCLELVHGGSLAGRLAGRPLPPRQAAALAEVLARAVHHAHSQQIVHRDLKPANVLLAPSDERRGILLAGAGAGDAAHFEPKITDFGLARLLDHDPDVPGAVDATGVPVGTPPYMAPEQAIRLGGDAYGSTAAGDGRATDIYALGAILYETLTGRPPFMGATVYDTLQQVVGHEPVPPRRLQPQVPRDLETICLACLHKAPGRRYATALDLADDLRRFLEGRPIRRRRPAFWEPAVKWARRRPAAAAWVVLGAIALTAAVAGSGYYLRHRHEWARQHALDRYQQFVRLRDDVLFRGTLLTAVRLAPEDQVAADLRETAAEAREALTLAGVPIEGDTRPAYDPYLTPDEQSAVATSCSELLLILSQVVAEPASAAVQRQRKEAAAEGLRILDGARQLGPPTRAFHLRRAHLLSQSGDESGAAAEHERASALRPVNASDYYFTGVDRHQQGDTPGAIRAFYEALRLRPDHFEAQCFLAVCSLNAGRAGEAQIGLTACIGRRPAFAWSYLLRGIAAVEVHAYGDAGADFSTALQLDDSASVRYAALANRGRLSFRQRKLSEAVADLESAVRVRPEECQAHLLLAQAYQGQKRFADADRELDAAARFRPDLPLVQRRRGDLLLERHEPDAALRYFEEAIRMEPAGSKSPALVSDYVECGGIRYSQGRFAEAVADCEAALRLAPEHALAHHVRGEALLKLKRPRDAEQAFGQSLKYKPGFGPALRARGEARVRLGDFAGAVDDYSQALTAACDASILQHRGWAYFFTDAWKLAQRDFDEAVRLDAQAGDARVGRGLARVMLGDYKRAVADAETVMREHEPRSPEMLHNVACIFALAVARVRVDSAEPKRDALEADYRRHSLAALRKALDLVPAQSRLGFWQEKMRPDSALDAIRQSEEFVRLDSELQKESSDTPGGEQGDGTARK
jgi:serine/threonine protein kinase/tetratricopeptide (TPR) repeat protein